MIAKRSRAHRSRFGGSVIELNGVSRESGAGGTACGNEGYEPSSNLATRILCG
jgi:hypothetical protein